MKQRQSILWLHKDQKDKVSQKPQVSNGTSLKRTQTDQKKVKVGTNGT
jgi:hypothetical protein